MNSQLKTYSNPDSRKSWIISAEIKTPKKLCLRFIPDKLIADHGDLINLLKDHSNNDGLTPEETILKLIENLNNELVPKWLEVIYENDGISVKIEDKQPSLQS